MSRDLVCREVVELLNGYLDQALPADAAHNPALFIRFPDLTVVGQPVHALRIRHVDGAGTPGLPV